MVITVRRDDPRHCALTAQSQMRRHENAPKDKSIAQWGAQ